MRLNRPFVVYQGIRTYLTASLLSSPPLRRLHQNSAHPMTDERVPGNKELRALIEKWGKLTRGTSLYFYGWFLAEPSAPNPMLTKWGTDVPIVNTPPSAMTAGSNSKR